MAGEDTLLPSVWPVNVGQCDPASGAGTVPISPKGCVGCCLPVNQEASEKLFSTECQALRPLSTEFSTPASADCP